MAKATTLSCIPDISGFTEFMSKIDFDFGSKIIHSLLNNIICSNDIGLRVSEIEVDAFMFYLQGNLSTLEGLLAQFNSNKEEEAEWAEISSSSIEDEHIAKLFFNYISLKPLL